MLVASGGCGTRFLVAHLRLRRTLAVARQCQGVQVTLLEMTSGCRAYPTAPRVTPSEARSLCAATAAGRAVVCFGR